MLIQNSGLGSVPLQPKLADSSQQTKTTETGQSQHTGGAKETTKESKSAESHKALHKSRSEAHNQKISAMQKKGNEAAHNIHQSMLKPVMGDRAAQNIFKSIHAPAAKEVAKKVAVRNARRAGGESNSSAEETKLKNAAMQASNAVRMRQMEDNDDGDMDAETDSGGSDGASGGGKDQTAALMMFKAMYGKDEQVEIEHNLSKLDNDKLSDDNKVKVVKSLQDSGMSKNPSLSENVIKTVNSNEFTSLSEKAQNTILNFISGENIKDNNDIKLGKSSSKENIKFGAPLENLELSKSMKMQGSNEINNLKYSYKDVGVDVKLNIMPQGKDTSLDLLSSKLEMKIAPFSKEKVNSLIDSIANKIAISSNQSQTKYKAEDLKEIVKSAVSKIYERERADKMNNFTVTLNSSNDILSVAKVYKQIEKTRLDPII